MAMMVEPIVSKTRVCIKNLPPKITEQDLKEFILNEQGHRKRQKQASSRSNSYEREMQLQITDCKILKNSQGKSRKVAFIGFRQPEQALHVIGKFHRTYLNMSRITVEAAKAKRDEKGLKDDEDGDEKQEGKGLKPNKNMIENSKQGSSALSVLAVEANQKGSDKKVEEFLSLMGAGNSNSKFWSNDTTRGEEIAGILPKPSCDDSNSDDTSSTSSSADDDKSHREDEIAKSSHEIKTGSTLSDLDFLRSKKRQVDDLEQPQNDDYSDSNSSTSSSSSSSSDNSDQDGDSTIDRDQEHRSHRQGTIQKLSDDIDTSADDDMDDEAKQLAEAIGASKTRLFVRNLAFETTEEELEEYFSPFGKVTECHIPVDDKKRNKGFGFITFESAVDAIEATNQLDKVDFQGRLLHILHARPPPQESLSGSENREKLSWKQRQELARKEKETKGSTGEASKGWSASFVRGDAVVDNLAQRLGLRKGDLLGVKDNLSSGDAAVRLALGETQIIEENRKYFRQHGVDMEALVSANENQSTQKTAQKRSKTAILVKNLPFDTRVEELEKLFHVGQEPVNILLPPSRTIAMIEYGHSTDAKRAFRKLAYRRFKHVPIYLEWAPLQAKLDNINNRDSSSKDDISSQCAKSDDNERPATEMDTATSISNFGNKSDGNDSGDDDGENDHVSSTLYIKNLNFETTEESLQQIFEKKDGRNVLSVRIPRKVTPTNSGHATQENRSLSMGYGFVELASHELAKKAIKMLQGKLVDGHSLQLAISSQKQGSRTPSNSASTGKKPPTKIMVRNVPFQATRSEILKLFGTFGQLKKVRLPKKFDGNHRGFAFVEYLTGKEASVAMSALSRTHLYGRHLVLEWASVDEKSDSGKNMERLRQKARRDAAGAAAASAEQKRKNKKIRFE
ncbi:unnamed protein product [Pseudo-nitzschia multistriata]|uniref:RRM domain-containing protein n=1 Tax=Pseudo-nitzschia multistriata TaxID=183589 RepID=A0A448YXW3_9STRA|nr:unnamed protein product [Pseudo-nitzschia multistriata]